MDELNIKDFLTGRERDIWVGDNNEMFQGVPIPTIHKFGYFSLNFTDDNTVIYDNRKQNSNYSRVFDVVYDDEKNLIIFKGEIITVGDRKSFETYYEVLEVEENMIKLWYHLRIDHNGNNVPNNIEIVLKRKRGR